MRKKTLRAEKRRYVRRGGYTVGEEDVWPDGVPLSEDGAD